MAGRVMSKSIKDRHRGESHVLKTLIAQGLSTCFHRFFLPSTGIAQFLVLWCLHKICDTSNIWAMSS